MHLQIAMKTFDTFHSLIHSYINPYGHEINFFFLKPKDFLSTAKILLWLIVLWSHTFFFACGHYKAVYHKLKQTAISVYIYLLKQSFELTSANFFYTLNTPTLSFSCCQKSNVVSCMVRHIISYTHMINWIPNIMKSMYSVSIDKYNNWFGC